jgi:hypothetical protein
MKQTTFLDKCKGIALVFSAVGLLLFGAAALVYSASPAQADNGPQTTYTTGKYMMSMTTIWADSRPNWYIIVWNTETGNSKFYYSNPDEGMGAASSRFQLPSSPL